MSADVAILIVTYNSSQQIVGCLRSVLGERQRVTQQVIVVDNASSDDTVAVIRENFPQVTVVEPGRNLGFAAGVNRAAEHADAEFLLLLNPDTVILDHAVDRIVDFARTRKEFTLVGGRAVREDGTVEPSSCWGLPTLWSLTTFALGLSAVAKRNLLLDPESLGRWDRDSVREVGMVSGCFLLIPQDTWRELGGFDERYFMYGEDADLARRAQAAGYRSGICPSARFVHEIGQSSATPFHKAFMLYRGKATYVRNHWTGIRKYLGLLLLIAGVWLRAVIWSGLRVLRPHAPKSAWLDLWRHRQNWIAGYSLSSSPARAFVPRA